MACESIILIQKDTFQNRIVKKNTVRKRTLAASIASLNFTRNLQFHSNILDIYIKIYQQSILLTWSYSQKLAINLTNNTTKSCTKTANFIAKAIYWKCCPYFFFKLHILYIWKTNIFHPVPLMAVISLWPMNYRWQIAVDRPVSIRLLQVGISSW